MALAVMEEGEIEVVDQVLQSQYTDTGRVGVVVVSVVVGSTVGGSGGREEMRGMVMLTAVGSGT